MCMPITIAYTDKEEEEESLLSMRNKKIDVWNLVDGKRITSVDVMLDEWSTRNEGVTIEKRTFVSMFGHVVYAGYRSSQYNYFTVDNIKLTHTKTLFRKYVHNNRAPEPDYAPDSVDHISSLALIESGGDGDDDIYVVVCNGKNRDVLFIGLTSQNEVRKVEGSPGPYMKNFYTLSEDFRLFFFTSEHSVGIWNVEKGTKEMLLEHPCQVSFDLGTGSYVFSVQYGWSISKCKNFKSL